MYIISSCIHPPRNKLVDNASSLVYISNCNQCNISVINRCIPSFPHTITFHHNNPPFIPTLAPITSHQSLHPILQKPRDSSLQEPPALATCLNLEIDVESQSTKPNLFTISIAILYTNCWSKCLYLSGLFEACGGGCESRRRRRGRGRGRENKKGEAGMGRRQKKVNGSSVKLRLKKEKIFVPEESTRENCGVIIWRSRTRSERDEACCGVSLGKEE